MITILIINIIVSYKPLRLMFDCLVGRCHVVVWCTLLCIKPYVVVLSKWLPYSVTRYTVFITTRLTLYVNYLMLRVREVPGSIPELDRAIKELIPLVHQFSTQHENGNTASF